MRKNKYMRHIAGIRKCLAIGLTAAMCMAMLAGCSTSQSTSSTSDTEVTSDVSTETDADKESPNGSADAENTSVKTEMTVEEMQAAIDEAMSDAAIDITDMFTKRDLAGNYDENSSFYKRQKALLDVIDYHIYEDKEGFQAALKKSKTDFVVTQIGLVDHDFLTECGCELIAQTESCYIYRFDYSKPRK